MRSLQARIFALTVLTVFMAGGALAQSKLYYAESKFFDPRMYRMNTDGSQRETLNSLPTVDWQPFGIDVDPVTLKLYYQHGEQQRSRIVRTNLNGSGQQVLVQGLVEATGLVCDWTNGSMFWTDRTTRLMYKANLDGTGLSVILSSNEKFGRPALDVPNGKIYFGNMTAGKIERADLDGSNREDVVVAPETVEPASVALDTIGGKIYWLDAKTQTNHIARADLDGTNVEVLIDMPTALSGLTNIVLEPSAGMMYWCDSVTASEQGVWSARMDGSNATRIFASPAGWFAGELHIIEDTTPLPCAVGTVDDANAGPTDILFVNGTAGGANREVVLQAGEQLLATVAAPPAGGIGRFVVHGNLGRPTNNTVTRLPKQIGDACFPILFQTGGNPDIIANNAGRPGKVGRSNFFGTPTADPATAPSTIIDVTSDPNLPPGTVITLHGAIFDPGSSSSILASTMNGVVIWIQ